jgi:hypothetical protein
LLYNKHNYHVDHIWNNDEIGIQASRQTKVRVLAKHGSQQVYKTIPKSRERFTINCGANIVKRFFASILHIQGWKITTRLYQRLQTKHILWQRKRRLG